MFSTISFKPALQTFKANNSKFQDRVGNESKISFTGDEVTLNPRRALTEKELEIVDKYVNMLAQLFLKNNNDEVKQFTRDNDIIGLGANLATTRAYKEAMRQKTREVEEKGLLPEEKDKIIEIADNYARLYISKPEGLALEDLGKFDKENNILLMESPYLPNHQNRKNFYNDVLEKRMKKLETENPDAYKRYMKEQEIRRKHTEERRLIEEADYDKKAEKFCHTAVIGLAYQLDPETRNAFFVSDFKSKQGTITDRNGLNEANTKAYLMFLKKDTDLLYAEITGAILKEYDGNEEAQNLISEAMKDVEVDYSR